MNFIRELLAGLVIGAGAIAPGVSGGTLAVIFGVYENLMRAIATLFRNFKQNVINMLPLGIGGVIGVVGFSWIIRFFFDNYAIQTKYLFIGLMVGTFPQLFQEANKKGKRKSYYLYFLATFLLTLVVTFLENGPIVDSGQGSTSFLMLILYGVIIGFGTIIPGISASIVLINLGAYSQILSAISKINLPLLIPVGIGFGASFLLFAKLIHMLYEKAYGYTFYAILGFVVGSVIPIFPGFEFTPVYFFSVLLLVVGVVLSYRFSKLASTD